MLKMVNMVWNRCINKYIYKIVTQQDFKWLDYVDEMKDMKKSHSSSIYTIFSKLN